jgi:hypothetical protein
VLAALLLGSYSPGHDWYGRSTAAGSLLLWTHLRKNIDWHDDGFVADGCDASSSLPAVTVGSGVQFMDLYPPAMARGKIVMGGTCDSVGVGGCWTAGCYGPFTKKFGNGAINILQVRVVLANGTLVIANKCSNPDLFWSIRGGGGGNTGVITEFTARSHRSPNFTARMGFWGSSATDTEFKQLLVQTLKMGAETLQNASVLCNDGSMGWKVHAGGGTVSLECSAYEGDVPAMKRLLQPLADWATKQGGSIKGRLSGDVSWNASSYDPQKINLPWMEKHPDREISTALLASMSKFFPAHVIATDAGATAVADAIVKVRYWELPLTRCAVPYTLWLPLTLCAASCTLCCPLYSVLPLSPLLSFPSSPPSLGTDRSVASDGPARDESLHDGERPRWLKPCSGGRVSHDVTKSRAA